MPQARLVVLSGPLAAGKTTLGGLFSGSDEVVVIRVRDEIARLASISAEDRAALLDAGADLERTTQGAWLVPFVAASVRSVPDIVMVDAIRTVAQVRRLREAGFDPLCVHLTASAEERARRYGRRGWIAGVPPISFEEASGHETEAAADGLRAEAHLLIDTTLLSPSEVSEITRLYIRSSGPESATTASDET